MSHPQSQPSRPTTRAKNATQHPGQVVLETRQKRRSAADMAKVRSQERKNLRLTNQRLYAALKNVAGIQDQQHIEDSENNVAKVAPSLRRHDTLASYPCARRVVPSMADDTTMVGESEKESAGPRDQSLDEVDQAGDGATEACTPEPEENDWFDDRSASEENVPVDVVADEEERPRKKRKGDGIRTVVESLRKSLRPTGEAGEGASKLKINVVNMPPPPIPTPKGKACATYVPFYLTVTATV